MVSFLLCILVIGAEYKICFCSLGYCSVRSHTWHPKLEGVYITRKCIFSEESERVHQVDSHKKWRSKIDLWPEARRVEIWGNETVVACIGLPRKKGKKTAFQTKKGNI